jgi:hypothetical protein
MTILASNGLVTNTDDSVFAYYIVSKKVVKIVAPTFSTDLINSILFDLAVPYLEVPLPELFENDPEKIAYVAITEKAPSFLKLVMIGTK